MLRIQIVIYFAVCRLVPYFTERLVLRVLNENIGTAHSQQEYLLSSRLHMSYPWGPKLQNHQCLDA